MRKNLVLITVIILMEQYNAQNHCKDIHQHVVSQGLHYIPGTNPCTLCVCDKGGPKWCKSVLCAPPQNCKSFQVGTLCCEFKCLDDILTVHDDTYDVALRFIASAVTAILSLSLLFFLFHRLKRRKVLVHQNQQLGDDQRSLNSIGYIAGSLGYLPENIGYLGSGNAHEIEFHYEESSTQYSLWKPPGNYFPRGEAPPPYEEAVRAAQLENNIINSQIRLANSLTTALNIPRQSPQNSTLQENTCSVPANNPCRHDCAVGTTHTHTHTHTNTNTHSNCPMTGSTQQYTNVIVQDVTVHNTNEPPKFDTVKQRVNNKGRSHSTVAHRSGENTNHERAYENIPLSSKSNVKRDKAATSGYKNQKTEVHEYTNVDKPTIKISKYDVIVESRADKPRDVDGVCRAGTAPSFHTAALHRPVPENIGDLAAEMKKTPSYELRKYKSGDRNARMVSRQSTSKDMPSHRTLPKNLRELLANAEQIINESSKIDDRETMRRSHASSYDILLSNSSSSKSQGNLAEDGTAVVGQDIAEISFIPPAPPNFASSTICESNHNNDDEEQLSLISYQCLSSSQDEDDYRSECENCKSSGFTIPEDEETDILNETMTLQRRPLETGEEVVPSYYRTSLTLPTNTRKSRAVVTNSNRESWFTSMQETSSSDDDV